MKSRDTGRKIVLLAGAWLCCAGALAVTPGEPMVTRTETVKYKPSEATTAEGAATLYRKLRTAAWRVCENPATSSARAPLSEPARDACMQKALDQAVASLANPMVAAIHQYGRPVAAPAVAAAAR